MTEEANVQNNLLTSITAQGRENLASQFPDEIEYYACALELVNSNGETVDFFSFPLLPNQLRESRQFATDVRKTMSGVVVTMHSTFQPFSINLNGNFGRRFRTINKKNINTDNTLTQADGQDKGVVNSTKLFSSDYKSGYGSAKQLENILKKATFPDSKGNPLYLFFYNLSWNSEYLVEVVSTDFSQGDDRNMIWNYAVTLTAIAPKMVIYSTSKSKTSLQKLTSFNKKNSDIINDSNNINKLLKNNTVNGVTEVQKVVNSAKNKNSNSSIQNSIYNTFLNSKEGINNENLFSIKNIVKNNNNSYLNNSVLNSLSNLT